MCDFCLKVVARDDDQGSNGQLSYTLSGGNEEGAFSLSSSGQLSVIQTLDREAQEKYTLIVTAIDSGKNPLRNASIMRSIKISTRIKHSFITHIL